MLCSQLQHQWWHRPAQTPLLFQIYQWSNKKPEKHNYIQMQITVYEMAATDILNQNMYFATVCSNCKQYSIIYH